MKLTATIAMCYPNAEILCEEHTYPPMFGMDIKRNTINLQYKDAGSCGDYPIPDCQLILTPLDKISEADAVVVANSVGLDTEGVGKIISTFIDFEKRLVLDFEYQVFRVRLSVEVIDYLRSKGYDCGHGSIPSLIAAGVAVEKEIV